MEERMCRRRFFIFCCFLLLFVFCPRLPWPTRSAWNCIEEDFNLYRNPDRGQKLQPTGDHRGRFPANYYGYPKEGLMPLELETFSPFMPESPITTSYFPTSTCLQGDK